jgi:FkbM family methyltransferase
VVQVSPNEPPALRKSINRFFKFLDLGVKGYYNYKLLDLIPRKLLDLYRKKRANLLPLAAAERKKLEKTIPFQPQTFHWNGKTWQTDEAREFLRQYHDFVEWQVADCKIVNGSGYIVDIGAWVGVSARYFRARYPQAQVVATEHNPSAFAMLKSNMEGLGGQPVRLIHAAAADTPHTEWTFCGEGPSGGRLAFDSDTGSLFQPPTIDIRTLLDRPVDLLKIDQPRTELKLLQIVEPLLDSVNAILVKTYVFSDRPSDLPAILTLLEKSGYRTYVLPSHATHTRLFTQKNFWGKSDQQYYVFATKS